MAVGYFSAVSGSRYLYGRQLKKAYAQQILHWLVYPSLALSILIGTTAPAIIKANSMVKAAPFTEEQAAIIAQVAPITSEPMTENTRLSQALATWASQHKGQRWGIALQDLSNNQVAGINTTNSFRSASVYKLYLMYPLLQKVPLKKFATTQISVAGQKRNLNECVEAMLRVSDNVCAEAIGNYVGWNWADKMLRTAGFSSTHLNFDAPITTANDTTRYLSALYRGKLVNQAGVDYIFGILGQQKFRDGIPTACKSSCEVMNKTGELQGILNDTAVIKIGEKLYILSVFSENGRYTDIASVSNIILANSR